MTHQTVNAICVEVITATFAQPRSYFITVQLVSLQNEKQSSKKFKTESSEITKQPQFSQATFQLTLKLNSTVTLEKSTEG